MSKVEIIEAVLIVWSLFNSLLIFGVAKIQQAVLHDMAKFYEIVTHVEQYLDEIGPLGRGR